MQRLAARCATYALCSRVGCGDPDVKEDKLPASTSELVHTPKDSNCRSCNTSGTWGMIRTHEDMEYIDVVLLWGLQRLSLQQPAQLDRKLPVSCPAGVGGVGAYHLLCMA